MTPSPTVRLRFDLRYDGADFHGWAAQDRLRTVEGEITTALETVARQPVRFTVAGRTDAGVHASAQVAHVDLDAVTVARLAPNRAQLQRLRDRLNRLLAAAYASRWRALAQRGLVPSAFVEKGVSDVVILNIQQVSDDFDARFSAIGRHYRYLIVDNPSAFNPITRTDRWWAPFGALDVGAMASAAGTLVGSHDFLSFCKPRPGATTIRTLCQIAPIRVPTRAEPIRANDHANGRADGHTNPHIDSLVGQQVDLHIEIRVSADAFCHSMVRSLVGALVEVGRGARDEEWIRTLLQSPGRAHPVPVAPARGLTLVGVDYPPEAQWRERNTQSRARRSPLV